jgi:hypothetical protein
MLDEALLIDATFNAKGPEDMHRAYVDRLLS